MGLRWLAQRVRLGRGLTSPGGPEGLAGALPPPVTWPLKLARRGWGMIPGKGKGPRRGKPWYPVDTVNISDCQIIRFGIESYIRKKYNIIQISTSFWVIM